MADQAAVSLGSPPASGVQRARRELSLQDALIGVAALATGVFLVWATVRARDLVYPLYQNADFASAPVLAQYLPDQGSGYVTLGFYPWLEPMLWLHLTRWLPDHLDA